MSWLKEPFEFQQNFNIFCAAGRSVILLYLARVLSYPGILQEPNFRD